MELGATAPLAKLYPEPLPELGVYMPEPGGSIELIAREAGAPVRIVSVGADRNATIML